MKGDIITYDYYGSLYINMTNRCDCHGTSNRPPWSPSQGR